MFDPATLPFFYPSSFSTAIKTSFGYDDSLDAFGVHGVGGFVGSIPAGTGAVRLGSAQGVAFVKGGLRPDHKSKLITTKEDEQVACAR